MIIAIIGPYVTPYDYTEYDYANTLAGPSAKHWFGTDNYGRDILSRMLVGTRLTLGVALSSVVVGAALGSILGLLAGYYGGIIEMLVLSTYLSRLWYLRCRVLHELCEVRRWR